MKRKKIVSGLWAILLFFSMSLFFQDTTYAETIELKISHIGKDEWTPIKSVLEPWAEKIEQLTNGRVKFTFYGNQVLGKAAEQYDLVIKGTADISVSLLSYNPGRFPLASVMELPFLSQSAEQGSLIFWSLYQKYLTDEFKDVKVLGLFCHGPGHLHTVNKEVKTLGDLKGLKIRGGSAPICKALELLGAVPIHTTVNDAWNLAKEGKIDGALLPWEGVISFDFYDLTPRHTEISMYTLTFFIVMSKEKYESLPDDIKKIIDENSGEVLSVMAGRAMDARDMLGRKTAIEKGQSIYTLPKGEFEKWRKIALPVGDAWIEEMEAKGLPGQKVLNYAVDLSIQLQNKAFSEEPIELKVSHFVPEGHVLHRDFLEPWARKIEKLTNERVRFTIYPDCQLGSPKEQYDLAVKGVADITLGVQSYTPERFLLTSCMSLPFMGDTGEKASVVLWLLYNKYLQDEYKDVKVLALFCHGPGQLHTVDKQVKTLEDLKGLKIRMANPFLKRIIERLGATAVVCPATEVNEKIKQKEIDGVVITWEAISNFKFYECKYHTVVNMYTLPFFVVMNKERYKSLPADIKKIIDENMGEEMSALAGRAMDNDDVRAKKEAVGRGDFIYTLSKQELERWKKIAMSLGDEWVKEMEAKGLPSREVLNYAVDLLCGIEDIEKSLRKIR